VILSVPPDVGVHAEGNRLDLGDGRVLELTLMPAGT